MKNSFVLTTCRFHTKDNNKLLVAGYFEDNEINENRVCAQLDDEEIFCEIVERRRVFGGLLTKTGEPINKEYLLWIQLPEDWEKREKFSLYISNEEDEQLAFQVLTHELKNLRRRFPKFVDVGIVDKTGFKITGWYIDDGSVNMQVLGESGKPLDVVVNRRQRIDVKVAFPENTDDEVVGFEIVYKGKAPRKATVSFTSNEKKGEYTVTLREPFLKIVSQKIRQVSAQTREYYQKFGFRATISKIFDRITRRELVTYEKYYRQHCPTKEMLMAQKEHIFPYQPKISIVIPLYKTPHNYLNELIQSVKNQTYANWELCLSDGSGENSPLTKLLKKYEAGDERIKVVYNQQPLQISQNTNMALEIATGDYIAFADHDDLLMPNTLFECVSELNKDMSIDMIYTDEDKIDMTGKEHFMPHFKSDFNIDMLRCTNYFCHFVVVKRDVFEKAGNLNSDFDGAQDYDFVLRCVEVSTNIKHISKVLYHWRAHKDSTAENPESKDYAFKAGARAVQAHYDRVGIKATVEETRHKGIYRTRYILQEQPLVSVIIPNKDHVSDLKKCIESIQEKSSYKNYELIVVENNSTEEETFEYYKKLEAECSDVKVVYWEGTGFNYPAINNFGVEFAQGEYLLFLNNDTEIVNADCFEELLGYCMRQDVGAVGARLYYEDGTIQHAGVVLGLGGIAGHAFVGCHPGDPGYFGRIDMAQNYSAVTAACMMVKKSVYEEVKGFDEKYAVAFNDVDLCMKIRQAGYLIVYNPYAELNHYESKSRGYEDTEEKLARFVSEIELFESRWGNLLAEGDPYYNPNLTLKKNDFSLNI